MGAWGLSVEALDINKGVENKRNNSWKMYASWAKSAFDCTLRVISCPQDAINLHLSYPHFRFLKNSQPLSGSIQEVLSIDLHNWASAREHGLLSQ